MDYEPRRNIEWPVDPSRARVDRGKLRSAGEEAHPFARAFFEGLVIGCAVFAFFKAIHAC